MESFPATELSPPVTGEPRLDETLVGGAARPLPALPAAPAGPTRIDGYELLGTLGRGGMGIVYKARQAGLDRLVALKVILTASPRDEELARFQIEAEAIGRLSHPNLVAVYEVGQWRENEHAPPSPYLVLEYVPGGTLDARLDRGAMPPCEAARLVEQLARALHVVHQQGIIHRDLKPANVLLAADGSPKISDFGLARKLGASSGVTQSGAVLGTPAFMAPEQAAGRIREVGAAADLHALGAILYQALTGTVPFDGATSWETMQKVINEPPLPPRRLAPEVPRDLETICLKCLQKEPRLRYADARALADDLERFLAGRPIEARPASWSERGWMWARRNPALATLTLICALAVIALFISGQVHLYRTRLALRVAKEHAAENRERLMQLCVMQGSQADENGDHAFALAWYVEALRLADEADEPDAITQTMHRRRIGRALRQVASLEQMWFHHGPVRVARLSATGARALTAADDGTAQLRDTTTGKAIGPGVRHGAAIVHAAFLDETRFVLGGGDGALLFVDAGTGSVTPLKGPSGSPHRRAIVALAVAGGRLLTASEEGSFALWKVGTSITHHGSGQHGGALAAASLSAGGRHVLTVGAAKARLWTTVLGPVPVAELTHAAPVTACGFAPDGQRLATGCADGTVHLWSLGGKRLLGPLRHRAAVVDVRFGPEGHRLVTSSDDHTAVVWDVRSGDRVVTLRHHSGVNWAELDAAGERIATASDDNTARIWSLRTGECLGGDLRHAGTVKCALFHPDGRLLTGSMDGTARLWRPRRMALVSEKGMPPPRVAPNRSGRWLSPDGRLVLTAEGEHSAQLRDAETNEPIGPALPHGSSVLFAVFAPRGEVFVTASDDNLARLWTPRGEPVGRPLAHRGTVRQAAFSDDGAVVATAGEDETVRLWSTRVGLPIGPPLPLPAPAEQLAFTAEGDELVVWHGGGRAVIDLRPEGRSLGKLRRLAQVLSGRQVDDRLGLVPLPPGRLQELWER